MLHKSVAEFKGQTPEHVSAKAPYALNRRARLKCNVVCVL